MAVSSAITAAARWSAPAKSGQCQECTDVLLVLASQRLHEGIAADVILAVRQPEPALHQEGDVAVFSPWMLGSTDKPNGWEDL